MKTRVSIFMALLGCTITSRAGELLSVTHHDLPVTVENSGSKDVDILVTQLVSKRPAPYPSGSWPPRAWKYITPEVETAIGKLKGMGPPIFPALVKHLNDDRYSYSMTSAAWLNQTVHDAVVDVLSDSHYMYGGYKARDTASGSASYLSFKDYLAAHDPVAEWAQWASRKSRLEIQLDFINWCIKEEQKRGFTDDEQRKEILDRYHAARENVTKEYSQTKAPEK